MITLAHNLQAMNAQRQFNIVNNTRAKSTEKLSSGYRVNRAADDAAGLAISEKMRRQVRGLTQASANVEEGIGYVQTADGALEESHYILQRMNELAVKAANGTLHEDDREYIDLEVQQLKEDLTRIFETTTYNEKLIWDPDNTDKVKVGTEKKVTASFPSSNKMIDINNKNVGMLPSGNIGLKATTADGISLKWTGNDGNLYETGKIDWSTLEANGYRFNMKDLYNDDKFYDTTVDPKVPYFDIPISLNVAKYAEYKDIADAINNTSLRFDESTGLSARFENSAGGAVSSGFSVQASISMASAYKSYVTNMSDSYSFDKGMDEIFVPKTNDDGGNASVSPTYSDVEAAKVDSTGWTFNYNMGGGIGPVTLKSTSVDYWAYDTRPETEHVLWDWATRVDGSKYKSSNTKWIMDGSLSSVMSALTGNLADSTPGILSEGNGGASDSGGYLRLHFSITDSSGNGIGSVILGTGITNTDTEDSVLNKFKDGLNNTSILDLYTTDSDVTGNARVYTPYNTGRKFDSPIYQSMIKFFVQADAEANRHIDIEYESLSTYALGVYDSNVLTIEDANKCIDDVKTAINKVSTQRSKFGAYQNRLEHAINSIDTAAENTQAAESTIRDTDMSKEMIKFSLNNILSQAGQSILAQANNINEGVLSLLQ